MDENGEYGGGKTSRELPSSGDLKRQQYERIRMVIPALFEKAKTGDVGAVGALLKCEAHGIKLLGSDTKGEDDGKGAGKYVFSWIDEEPPDWFTPGEAGEILGVSVRTVQRYITQGQLAAFKTPGGYSRVRGTDLERLRGLPPKNENENHDIRDIHDNRDTGTPKIEDDGPEKPFAEE